MRKTGGMGRSEESGWGSRSGRGACLEVWKEECAVGVRKVGKTLGMDRGTDGVTKWMKRRG